MISSLFYELSLPVISSGEGDSEIVAFMDDSGIPCLGMARKDGKSGR